MIALNRTEVSAEIEEIETAAQDFDSSVAGSSPARVDGGTASFVLEDVLAVVAETALRIVQHVDATGEIAKLAVNDLFDADASMSEDLASFEKAQG